MRRERQRHDTTNQTLPALNTGSENTRGGGRLDLNHIPAAGKTVPAVLLDQEFPPDIIRGLKAENIILDGSVVLGQLFNVRFFLFTLIRQGVNIHLQMNIE